LQLGINVTWHDSYCQQHDENSNIKTIFSYQISYPNTKKMNDSVYPKSKLLHLVNIWNDDIDDEINDSCLVIPITNTINIEHYIL
jgi:hypothetical protein